MKSWIPTAPEFARETIIVMGGALLAALIFSQMPALKKWVADRLPTAR